MLNIVLSLLGLKKTQDNKNLDQKLKDIRSLRYNSILINKYINEIFNYFISLFIFNNFMNIFKIKKVKY
jgi:hypothetical protein